MPRRRARAAALVFTLLVLATLAAFAWAQRVKRDPLILDKVTIGTKASRGFTPNGDCRFDSVRIRFRVTRSDDATVQITKPGGQTVATLARDQFLKRYHFFTFYWDGHSREGGIAPFGRYKLRVRLLGQERVLAPPGVIHLNRAPRKPTKGCRPNQRKAP